MKQNLICLFLLWSFYVQAQEKQMDLPLCMKTFTRLEKNDTIFRNNLKTYSYSDYRHLNKMLLDILLAEKPRKYNPFSDEDNSFQDTLSDEEIRNRLGYGVYRHIISDEEGNELYTEVLQTVIEDTSATKFILGFDETWHFNSNTLQFEKYVKDIEILREFTDEESQKVRTTTIAAILNNKQAGTQTEKIAQVTYEHPLLITIDWVINDSDTDFVKRMDHAGLLNYSLVIENEEFNSCCRNRFIREIFTNGFDGKLKIIDYDSRKPLTRKEIIEKLMRIDGFIPSGDTYESEIESGTIATEAVDALIFNEDWYFDSKTISFSKKVREISFVKYTYDKSDLHFSKPQRNILFTVLFE